MATHFSVASSSTTASSSASTSYPRYDIFINHRGPDVKDTFATNLYRRLLDHGLQVFLDKPELLQGHRIDPQIQAAIGVASVHIAIFSPTYAESKWCLDELVLMVDSGATILPVFYKVKPSELRWTDEDRGPYAKALRDLQQKTTHDSQTGEEKPRYNTSTIQNWRRALSSAADISGFELDGDEEDLLSKVVQGVLKNVPKPPLYVAKYPTGLEEKLQEFEMAVLNEKEGPVSAKVVGIVGFGGVGKTTLAREFFNRKRSLYSESCFLFDVRETLARRPLDYLQSKLLEDLKHKNNIKIESPYQGIGVLKRYLSSCHALIIIDDVDNASHLEMLLPVKDILSAQSLILVTTRDKHVLKESGVLSIYNLTGLNTLHSKELFCSYAFHKPFPPPEFADLLVDRFVTACDGLPLSLKVIGALLFGENEEYWEEQLDQLRQALPEEIHKILKISYDSLTKQDKPIFLDIACFFVGENRDRAIRIWGLAGIRNIENKCLLEVDSENKIRMHDHIRGCARSIAEEEPMPRRLWHQTADMIDDLLKQLSSVEIEVRGITSMVSSSISDVVRQTEHGELLIGRGMYRTIEGRSSYESSEMGRDFRGMKNLRLVAIEGAFLEGILRRVQSPQLIWLRWYGCSSSSLPDWIPMKNLRVLEVVGRSLNSLWPHQSQAPVELRELNIWAPLSEFPKSIEQLKHLEWITIGDPELSSSYRSILTTLPEEFCHLRSLKYLVLKGLSRLRSLPDAFGKLTNLQHINLEGACSLRMLPDSFGGLTRLKHLSLSGCSNLTISKGTLGNITMLEYLDFRSCSNVEELPPQVAHLQSLKELYLQSTNLKELPSGIGYLCNLEVLEIGNDSLEVLPFSLGDLKSLKRFSVSPSPKLNCLPDSFCTLTQLRELTLHGCVIEYLPQDLLKIINLKSIMVWDVPLREFPFKTGEGEEETLLLKSRRAWNILDSHSDKFMFGLNRLYLWGTKISEVAFPEGVCPNLRRLEFEDCPELRRIGGLSGLAKLSILNIKSCVKVEELASLETLRSLEEISINGCKKLKSIQGLAQLTKLRRLVVGGCHEIVGLPGLGHCTSLEYLDALKCPKLKRMQGLAQCKKLQYLKVRGCHEIERLPGVEHCISLLYLDARACPKLSWDREVLRQLRRRLKRKLWFDEKPYRQYKRFKLL